MSGQQGWELEVDTKKPVCLAHSEGRGKGAQETERNYGEFTSSCSSETDTPLPAHVQVGLKDPDLQAGNHGPRVSIGGCTTHVTSPPLHTVGVRRKLSSSDVLSALQNQRLEVPCLLYMAV